jgi:hypothetical protein
MRENKSTSHSHYSSAARDLPLANAKANAVVGCERENAGDPPSPGFTRGLIEEAFAAANALSVGSVLAAASTATTACAYTPRLKSNRYSNNRIIAPTTDMIQPAT